MGTADAIPVPVGQALTPGLSLRESWSVVTAELAAAGIASPEADARWLLADLVGIDPHRDPEGLLSGSSLSRLRAAIARRVRREPLQLILGTAPFRGLDVRCRSGVFIPRPETEIVAGLAIDAARRVRDRNPVVIEPCTGTGAISCAIATEVPDARIVASDRDRDAVDLARANLERVATGRAGPVGFATGASATVVLGDLLAAVDRQWRGRVDVLVANPPYLPAVDRLSWAPEVAAHDPDHALVGGDDGHEVVNALLHAAATWLRPGGTVVVEIDERRGAQAVGVARSVGLRDVEIAPDLTGADRAVVARRAG